MCRAKDFREQGLVAASGFVISGFRLRACKAVVGG